MISGDPIGAVPISSHDDVLAAAAAAGGWWPLAKKGDPATPVTASPAETRRLLNPFIVSAWAPWARRDDRQKVDQTAPEQRRLFLPVVAAPDWWPLARREQRQGARDEEARPNDGRDAPASILTAPFQIRVPVLVPWDPKAPVRSRRHQMIVSQMFNALVIGGELKGGTDENWFFGYPTGSAGWDGGAPREITEALDRLARSLVKLTGAPIP